MDDDDNGLRFYRALVFPVGLCAALEVVAVYVAVVVYHLWRS